MTLKSRLNNSIGESALLNSRFYQAWNAGELPRAALAQYAGEYGRFIQMLPAGWETLADAETAEEEHEHAELWEQFAAALDTQVAARPAARWRDWLPPPSSFSQPQYRSRRDVRL